MNILDRIAADKKEEVRLKKKVVPLESLRETALFMRDSVSLKTALQDKGFGIIAEHKRRSPSRAVINQDCSVKEVVSGYEKAGAAGISVLTDGKYFGGSLEDLLLARATTSLPILRKEFMIDSYQLTEARAYGADAILLIAALLSPGQIADLAAEAQVLGLEVLVEIHGALELEAALQAGVDMIGVNNRNLKTFEVSLDTSRNLASAIPDAYLKISESGLGSADQLQELKAFGYQGFLMGESFMKEKDPGAALSAFVKPLTG
ncbi:indole-3-glycerol phosphate synthase TrpC [Robiginitalea sp. IMCC43444]|uniref:indole-3-glycerol phosphate synthase TrpC n=1 Tax=Robiginitalea sp. IMCC43444 TaxID=3459121 RepID=UPI0040418C48